MYYTRYMPRKKTHILEKAARTDGFANVFTGLGYAARDKRLNACSSGMVALPEQELQALYAGNDLAQIIASRPATDGFREWITIDTPDDPDVGEWAMQRLDELKAKRHCIQAQTYAYAFGGACILLGTDDGQDPSMPLNVKVLPKRGIPWMTVYDRFELQVDGYYSTVDRYGEPEYYRVRSSGLDAPPSGSGRIHESRLIRFHGAETTRQYRRQYFQGWDASVFQRLIDRLRGYETAWDSAEALMQDFAQAVYKIKGLAELLSEGGEAAVIARLQTVDASRSILRSVLIDADAEDFSRQQTPMSGLPELLDRWMYRLASAARMPVTILFGASPGGLGSNGEGEMRTWYDNVAAEQERIMSASMEQLVKRVLQSHPQGEPMSWKVRFNPLWQPSQAEELATRKVQAEIDQIYVQMDGGLTGQEVLDSRFGSGTYSFETQLDGKMRAMVAAAAQNEYENPTPAAPGSDGTDAGA